MKLRPTRARHRCPVDRCALALVVVMTAVLAAPAAWSQPTVTPKVTFNSIDNLAWMAGGWTLTEADRTSEEHWMAPLGGAMLGMHRDVRGGKMTEFEFLRIEARPDAIYYVASPGGAAPVDFRLMESGKQRVVFFNPDHDFPKRILYWVDDAGAMHARIEGETPDSGQEWTWTRLEAKTTRR